MFLKELKQYRHSLPKQTISNIKGMALAGDIEVANKRLLAALNKKQSKSEVFTNAHRNTRYITKNYNDTDYRTQFGLSLRGD